MVSLVIINKFQHRITL